MWPFKKKLRNYQELRRKVVYRKILNRILHCASIAHYGLIKYSDKHQTYTAEFPLHGIAFRYDEELDYHKMTLNPSIHKFELTSGDKSRVEAKFEESISIYNKARLSAEAKHFCKLNSIT